MLEYWLSLVALWGEEINMDPSNLFNNWKSAVVVLVSTASVIFVLPAHAKNYTRAESYNFCIQTVQSRFQSMCAEFADAAAACQSQFDGDLCHSEGLETYINCRVNLKSIATCTAEAIAEVQKAADPELEPEPETGPDPSPGPTPFPPGHRPDDRPWADLIFESNPSNPFRAHIVISQDAVDDGCPSGQRLDARFRRCVSPYGLYAESHWVLINERACPPGQVGSIKTLREHRRTYFGWWIDYGDGVEQRVISHHTDNETDETRVELDCVIPPPPPPEVGQTFNFRADLICGSSDPGYHYDPPGNPNQKICITSSFRNSVISTYRNESEYGRCPERGGFEHWVWAIVEVYSTQGLMCDQTRGEVLSLIKDAFDRNHDDGSWDCQSEANRRWKPAGSVLAEMVPGSGRRCRITRVP